MEKKDDGMPEINDEVKEKMCKVLNDKKIINMNILENAIKQSLFNDDEGPE